MKKSLRFLSLFLALLFLLSLAGCSAAPNETPPLLWKVTSNTGGVVYLFGSVHVGDKEMADFPNFITDAFSKSEILAVELDVIALEENLAAAMDLIPYMIYSDGSKISDHISSTLYQEAKQKLQDAGLYIEYYDIFRTYVWENMLSLQIYKEAGLSEEYGVDMVLLKKAKDAGKKIDEIESAQEQYELLSGNSDHLQELMLQDVLKGIDSGDAAALITKLANAWKHGDLEQLEKLALAQDEPNSGLTPEEIKELEEYSDKLLNQRDEKMTDAAEKYLKDGKHVFYVVGMAHMLGDMGIVAGLQKRGYTVAVVGR